MDITSLILAASYLPGYKIHPRDTYIKLESFGLKIEKQQDIFKQDIKKLKMATEATSHSHCIMLAATSTAANIPGGILGTVAGTMIDVEEAIRRFFLVVQQVGHIYGVIPNPHSEKIPETLDEYFRESQEFILEGILIGLATGTMTEGIGKLGTIIAEKKAKDILRNKVSQEIITQIAKKIAQAIGIKLTKKTISKTVLRVVPVIGGAVSGGISYYVLDSFSKRVIDAFEELHLKLREDFEQKQLTKLK